MVSATPYCKKCKPKGMASVSGPPDLCSRKHTGNRFCNGCGNLQRQTYVDDWQECQEYVARDEGRWTSFGFCSNKARGDKMHQIPERYGEGKRWRYLCHIHDPEGVAKRTAKAKEKWDKIEAGWARRAKRNDDRHDMEDILLDVAKWMAKNAELVAEDEWLQSIANKMADNDMLLEKLEHPSE